MQCCPNVWNWPTSPLYATDSCPASVMGPQLEWPNLDFSCALQFSNSWSALQTSNHSSMMAPVIQKPRLEASLRPEVGVLLPPFHTSYNALCCFSGWIEPWTYAGKPNSKITGFTLPEASDKVTVVPTNFCFGWLNSSLMRRTALASTSSATACSFNIQASKRPGAIRRNPAQLRTKKTKPLEWKRSQSHTWKHKHKTIIITNGRVLPTAFCCVVSSVCVSAKRELRTVPVEATILCHLLLGKLDSNTLELAKHGEVYCQMLSKTRVNSEKIPH